MKVTQNVLAQRLNVTRNTVSKGINNDPAVSYETRYRLWCLAKELGYDKMPILDAEMANETNKNRIVSVLAHYTAAENNSFWMQVISGIEKILASAGYYMSINFLKKIPKENFDNSIAGYIMLGMFDKEDYVAIAKYSAAVTILDAPVGMDLSTLNKDIILMSNAESVHILTKYIIDCGHTNIAFVGNAKATRSYNQRYKGFSKALNEANLTISNHNLFLDIVEDYSKTGTELEAWLKSFDTLPTAIVCAHDTLALLAVKILGQMGVCVPDDVSIVGFDNIDEINLTLPKLSTVECNKKELGMRIAEELLWRMKNPKRPYEVIQVSTAVLMRDSVRKLKK